MIITATPAAKQRINEQIKARGKGLGIHVGVRTTGCSGLAYVIEFVDAPDKFEYIQECGIYSIYVDAKSLPYLEGMTIDYVRKGLNEGFEFINPNEKDKCGCGESFNV
jgi:iron-sulfur cluster assembly protein